jgi:hypothetical protein
MADAEASAICLRQHRVTGYAALETMRSWKPSGFGNFHQQPFGLGVLDAIDRPAANGAANLHSYLRPRQLMAGESDSFRLWKGK